MKRCSTCNRTYTDPNLSYCIDDGTPLTTVDFADESTVVSPREGEPEAYRPPGSYVPSATPARGRRVWPLVLGIVGAFILGIIVISIAAAILAPRFIRSRQAEQARNTPKATPEAGNVNQPENANVAQPANSNSDANVNSDVDTSPPADHDHVLVQLTDLEHDWTAANLNADKKELDRILADDYVGPAAQGGLQSKAEYIASTRRDPSVNVSRWEFGDLKLTLAGDRAKLSGNITYVTPDGEVVFDFTDKFVWRDGRWQATGSEVKRRE